MGKSLTLNEVKEIVRTMSESEIIEEEYLGTKAKMRFRCKCGEIFVTSFEKFKYQNKRCCNNCNGVMTWDFKSVKKYIEDNSNCKIISTEYINYNTKLELMCECGDKFWVSFNKFKCSNKRLCNKCSKKMQSKRAMLTMDEVINFVKDNSDCKLISTEYKGAHENLEFECKCGNRFQRTFDNFKTSVHKSCETCTTIEIFNKQRLSNKEVSDVIASYGCEYLEGYKNRRSVVKIKCSCGKIFEQTYDVFVKGESHFCQECANKKTGVARRVGYNKIKFDIETLSKCKLITTNENLLTKDKIKLLCLCGNIFTTNYYDFIRSKNKQCKCCSGINEFILEDVIDYIENNSNCKFVSGDYENMYSKIMIKCSCGEIYETTFGIFKFANKRQCNRCGWDITSTKTKLSFNDVKDRIENNGNLLLSKQYINNSQKLKLKCKCGRVFYRSLSNYTNGSDCCDYCNKSRGEQYIYRFFEYNKILFKQQVQFSDCRGKRKPLPFDFGIYDENNNLLMLIEYQGRQHYEYIQHFHRNKEGFERQKEYDEIKKIYCENNNITLLEIPYYNKEIGNILVNKLETINIVSFIMQKNK